MRDAELSRDVTGSNSIMRQLHNPLSDHIGQWSAIHKHSTELIHASMTWKLDIKTNWMKHKYELPERVMCRSDNCCAVWRAVLPTTFLFESIRLICMEKGLLVWGDNGKCLYLRCYQGYYTCSLVIAPSIRASPPPMNHWMNQQPTNQLLFWRDFFKAIKLQTQHHEILGKDPLLHGVMDSLMSISSVSFHEYAQNSLITDLMICGRGIFKCPKTKWFFECLSWILIRLILAQDLFLHALSSLWINNEHILFI